MAAARSRSPAPRRSPRLAAKAEGAPAAKSATPTTSDSDLRYSLKVYGVCVSLLALALALAWSNAPQLPKDELVCQDFGFGALFTRDPKKLLDLIKCAKAYQKLNTWFVTSTFELTYISIKMLAIPAVFPLGILGGAIFPFPVTLTLTGFGEAFGSSLCYLMSRSLAQPVLQRFFPKKLRKVQELALEVDNEWFLFNLFLRLTPVVCATASPLPVAWLPASPCGPLSRPNWFVNMASPIVGNPLKPFFIGSLIGTQARRDATPLRLAKPCRRDR